MRKFVLALAIAAVALGSAGCFFDNIYLDFLVELEILGRYERVMCWDFPNTPLEILGGPTYVGGQIYPPHGHEGELPGKLNTRLSTYDVDGSMLGRSTYKFKVDNEGMFSKEFNMKAAEVPPGGSLCIDAQAKGGSILEGSKMRINAYRMDDLQR